MPHTSETAAGGTPPSPSNSQLEELQKQQQLDLMGRKMLSNHQPAAALKKFEELVARQKKPTDALAYLSLATLLSDEDRNADVALSLAQQALFNSSDNGLAHAAMSRAYEALDRYTEAELHKEKALSLSRSNPIRLGEVKSVLLLTASARQKRRLEQTNNFRAFAWVLPPLVLLILFSTANLAGMGKREYFYEPLDGFFWIRRLVLIAGALVGTGLLLGTGPVRALKKMGWHFNVSHTISAIALGSLVGYLTPLQHLKTPLVALLIMAWVSAFAEEVFFRGFVTKLLNDAFTEISAAVMLSGIIYGVYRLTFYSFWVQTTGYDRWYWACATVLAIGLPHAWLYLKSRSLSHPLLSRVLIDSIMMITAATHHR